MREWRKPGAERKPMGNQILIVSDASEVLEKVVPVVRAEGYEVKVARSPSDAAMMLRAEQPEVIVYDATVPHLASAEAVGTVTLAMPTWQVPVIALTQNAASPDQLPDYFKVYDVVPHPFAPLELSARLKAAVRTKRFQDQLREAALVDPATSLLNRAAGEQRLREEISRSIRYGRALALLLLKVFGEPVEPEMQEIGRITRKHTRLSDVVCRYDLDTLMLALPETGPFGAARVAQNIQRLVESNLQSILESSRQLRGPGEPPRLSLAFGTAGFVEGDDFDSLMDRARKALEIAGSSEDTNLVIARRDPLGTVRYVKV
jgi:two-component system cell cycle response regulator